MATPPKISGDRIRDDAELTGEKIKQLKHILHTALRDAPVDPRKWVQYIGAALEAAEAADLSNEAVKQTIYESRKRGRELE